MMFVPHQGGIVLRHNFSQIWDLLNAEGDVTLQTSVGTPFKARATVTRDGRQVIRFFQDKKEYGRSYECCWGHYYNCNRTRIGMYCRALDSYF